MTYHQTVVLFNRDISDTDKPMLVGSITPLKSTGGTTEQVRTCNLQGDCDPGISVALVTAVSVPVVEV